MLQIYDPEICKSDSSICIRWWSFQAGDTKPIPLIRLAELYLNLAECQANVGGANLANALANLKEVRDRAGVPTTTTVPEQSKLIEMIHNERFIEFWNEGHRYHDVRPLGGRVRNTLVLNVRG